MSDGLTPEEQTRRDLEMRRLRREVIPRLTRPELHELARDAVRQLRDLDPGLGQDPDQQRRLDDLWEALREVGRWARVLTDWVAPDATKTIGLRPPDLTLEQAIRLSQNNPDIQDSINALASAMATRTILSA